jgi:hypothetical protein
MLAADREYTDDTPFLSPYVSFADFEVLGHDRTQDKFEALKPYVCSKPLCLYQVSISNFSSRGRL